MEREVLYRRGRDEFTLRLDVEAGALRSSYQGNSGGGFKSRLPQDLRERAAFRDQVLRDHGFVPEKPVESLFERVPAIGCDLDGTFFRRKEGPGARDWFDWHRVEEDFIDEMVSYVLDLVNHDGVYQVVFMSGRPDDLCREPTERALSAAQVDYAALYMRPALDNRADDVVKEEMFRTQVEPYWDMRLMLDDRDRVVGMWRDRIRQFPCWQVAPGKF